MNDGAYFGCIRTWADECGDDIDPPLGFGTTDTYHTICPTNPCYEHNGADYTLDGKTYTENTWKNIQDFRPQDLTANMPSTADNLKAKMPSTADNLKAKMPSTAAMMQVVGVTGNDAGILTAAGGLSCLAIGAVLFVASARAKSRRSTYVTVV